MATSGGRPAIEFTGEQIDAAKLELGRRVYPSKAAAALAKRFRLGKHTSYRLVEAAQRAVYESLRGDAPVDDPTGLLFLFLISVLSDARAKFRDKVAAAGVAVRLLGLHKLADVYGSPDVDRVLGEILERQQAARRAAVEPGPAERT